MHARILLIVAMLSWPWAVHAQPSIVHKPGPSHEGPHLTFSMDATSVQIHSMADSSLTQVVFPGHIGSDIPVVWTLTTQPTNLSGPPNLILVEDVMGHRPTGQTVIPLTWEFALDRGAYTVMQLTRDNSLQVIIPPGMHSFQLRATSPPLLYQAAGYYNLKMAMQFSARL